MHRQHQHQHHQHLHAHMNARMLERTHARSFLHCTALHYPLPRWHVLTPMDANTHTHTHTHIRIHTRARLLPRTHTHTHAMHCQSATVPRTMPHIPAHSHENLHRSFCRTDALRYTVLHRNFAPRAYSSSSYRRLLASICVCAPPDKRRSGRKDAWTHARKHLHFCIVS